MSTDYGRFGITLPDDTDSPNGPANFRAVIDDVEKRLGYAGAHGGKSIIAPAQSPSSTANYNELGTPDRVSSIVVQNDGDLLHVVFSALVKSDGTGANGKAAIFVGANQTRKYNDGGAPATFEAAIPLSANYNWLRTDPTGLVLADVAVDATDASATDGLIAAQPLVIDYLAAGTYNISVQFKGTYLTVQKRRLRAWTKEFPTSGV